MASITIIAIVVVALLTLVIFGLTWVAYSSCIRAYKLEVSHGKHDEEIYKEYHSKKTRRGLGGLISSYLVLSLLFGLFTIGIVYKARGENLSFNNQTVLVIKSGSMSNFYDDEIANKYNNDRSLQFDVGDICLFEKVDVDSELIEGEVYGYRSKNIVITHRLVSYNDGLCEFRGDNNPISDGLLISRENILYHYLGERVPAIGSFILYAQSIFGIWSLIGIISIAISSEIVYYKIDKINKERDKLLPTKEEKVEEILSVEDLDREKFSKFVAYILDIWPEMSKGESSNEE